MESQSRVRSGSRRSRRLVRLLAGGALVSLLLAARWSFAQNGETVALALGTASGEPGELVDVEIRASFFDTLAAYVVVFRFDPERLGFVGLATGGTAVEGVLPTEIFFNVRDNEGLVGIGSTLREDIRALRVPPGDDVLIGKLRFRVLAAAAPGQVTIEVPERLSFVPAASEFNLINDATAPNTFAPPFREKLPGSVTVLEPTGPRPVGELACDQVLDEIRLDWVLTEAYDAIEVRRGGELVAILGGDATEYVDALGGRRGRLGYSVVALQGGESSVAVSCEIIAVRPVAPAVTEFTCADGDLGWMNATTYDRLLLFKNGEQLTELAGDAVSFRDDEAGTEQAVYTLVGELRGFRSPEVNCLLNGVTILEIADVVVPPGATRFRIPILVTVAAPLAGFQLVLDLETDRLALVQDVAASFDGTVSYTDPELIFIGPFAVGNRPSVGLFFDALPPLNREKNVPVGVHQRVFNFVFDVEGEFARGETLDVAFDTDNTTLNLEQPGQVNSLQVRPDSIVPGRIIFGGTGVHPVQGLLAEVVSTGGVKGAGDGSRDVELSWENGSTTYDSVHVERNGGLLAELVGNATSYTDRDVPTGLFTYKVTGIENGSESFPRNAFLSTFLPYGAFIRGDVNFDTVVDLSDSVRILEFLFLSGAEIECEDAADSDDDGIIDITDPINLLSHEFLGRPVIPAPGRDFPWLDPTPDNLSCER